MTLRPTRRAIVLAGLAGLTGAKPARGAGAEGAPALPYTGVNLAGADFGALPGQHGRDYLYPTRANLDYYRALGFNTIRLPFKWERLQPRPMAPFAGEELARLRAVVEHATGLGLRVILDPHNYAKRRLAEDGWAAEHLIGSAAVPVTAFADLWRRLSLLYAGDERVLFGLMNEPAGPTPAQWLDAANAAVEAIRTGGATNLVLVPGVAYTGAHSWYATGNTAMAVLRDPARRFAFDVHQYFDRDSSGTRPEAVSGSIGAERIEAFQEWARGHGFRAFLGEFGAARDPASLAALDDLCREMEANPDVWLGWTAWAGGPRWPVEDMFNLEPYPDGRVREQTRILAGYAMPRGAADRARPGAAIDLDLARGGAFGVDGPASVLRVARASPGFAEHRSGRLDAFPENTLRITDRGLLVEEERWNALGGAAIAAPPWEVAGRAERAGAPSPLGTEALTLRAPSGPGWCAASREADLPSLPCTLSVHARHHGGRWLTLRGDHPSSRYAAFDLEAGRAGSASADGGAIMGRPGEWQRVAMTWTPERAAAGRIVLALGGGDGNAAPHPGGNGAVDLWGASLEQGPFPTSFTAGRRRQDVVEVTGPLLALLQGPALTLVVETRELPQAPVACEIAGADALPLLRRGADGALETGAGLTLRTAPQPLDRWRMRRRTALSLDRESGRVVLAATGVGAVTGAGRVSSPFRQVQLGTLGPASLNGFVTRITAYASALDADALAALVA